MWALEGKEGWSVRKLNPPWPKTKIETFTGMKRQTAQQELTAAITLPEDFDLIPGTHRPIHNYNSSPRASSTHLWPPARTW